MRIKGCSSLAVGLIVAGFAASAQAAPYSLEQKNFFAMEEAAIMVRSEMQTVYTPTSDALLFTGTFSASGWGLTITGTMAGQPVSYTATGVYNSGTQTTNYTSAGTVGADNWAGDGFMSFFDVFTEISLESMFHTADTVTDTNGVKPTKKPDKENQTTKTYKTVNNKIIDTGEYYNTEDGVVVGGPFTQTSSAPIGDGNATINIDDAFLTGTVTGGSFTGMLIPEPSSVGLVMFTAAAACLRRRR